MPATNCVEIALGFVEVCCFALIGPFVTIVLVVKQALSVSIVIPVYNEEGYIGACLDAIAKQTTAPLEVIVVDNNCTDRTVEIARTYPFVKIIEEKRQGRGYARSAGFNAAKGEIVGRIDADSLMTPVWVERVINDFDNLGISGVTGLGQTNLILGLSNLYTTFWSRVYFWTTHSFFKATTMWGANMAVRRMSWEKVKGAVTLDDTKVHEDQDLSLLILGQGGSILQDNKLLVKTAGRSYLYWPKFKDYFKRTIQTKTYHTSRQTLSTNSPLRPNFWKTLPGAILGWTFSTVFIIYSLLAWPAFAIVKSISKDSEQVLR